MDDEPDQLERLDAFFASLQQADKKALRRDVEALIAVARDAPEVAVKLRDALDRVPAEKRWPIAYVLAHISPLSPPCLEALKSALQTSDPDIRWAVALLLVDLEKKPNSGVAAHLIDLIDKGNPAQRRMAVYCLRDIHADDPTHGHAVQNALEDLDPLVRIAALTSLKAFPMIGGSATDRLLELVATDADSRVRSSAAIALAHLAAPTEKVFRALNDAARSSDIKLAKAARAALALLENR
ncbi:MAG: HEAT repeat domain-containing protein [Candidatus Binatia bacterium]